MAHEAGTPQVPGRRRIAGAVAILAGVVATAACFWTWIDAFTGEILFGSARVGGSASGVDTNLGRVAFIAAVLTVVGGGLLLLLRSGRLSGLLILLAGVAVVLCASLVLADPEAAFADAAVNQVPSTVVPAELVESTIEQQLSKEGVDVQPGVGLYVALAGGSVAVIAGGLGIAWGRRRDGSAAPGAEAPEPDARGMDDERAESEPAAVYEGEPEPGEALGEQAPGPEDESEERAPGPEEGREAQEPDALAPPETVSSEGQGPSPEPGAEAPDAEEWR